MRNTLKQGSDVFFDLSLPNMGKAFKKSLHTYKYLRLFSLVVFIYPFSNFLRTAEYLINEF